MKRARFRFGALVDGGQEPPSASHGSVWRAQGEGGGEEKVKRSGTNCVEKVAAVAWGPQKKE